MRAKAGDGRSVQKGDGTQPKTLPHQVPFFLPRWHRKRPRSEQNLCKATDSLQLSIGSLPKSSKDCLGLRVFFFSSFFNKSSKKYSFSGDQVALVGPGDVWVVVTVEFLWSWGLGESNITSPLRSRCFQGDSLIRPCAWAMESTSVPMSWAPQELPMLYWMTSGLAADEGFGGVTLIRHAIVMFVLTGLRIVSNWYELMLSGNWS